MSIEQYKYVNLDAIDAIADGDREFVNEIIENFLSVVHDDVRELNVALEEQNDQNIVFFAHRLKGTFSFVGAEILQKLTEEIQTSAADRQLVSQNVASVNKYLPLVISELTSILGRS